MCQIFGSERPAWQLMDNYSAWLRDEADFLRNLETNPHTAQIRDDSVWEEINEIALAEGERKEDNEHNYIELKHRARYNDKQS